MIKEIATVPRIPIWSASRFLNQLFGQCLSTMGLANVFNKYMAKTMLTCSIMRKFSDQFWAI
jgi:hypothetical protein